LQREVEDRMKRAVRFARSVATVGPAVVIGLIAGVIAGGFLGVAIAMLFHVL
jgi:hypothetical protein